MKIIGRVQAAVLSGQSLVQTLTMLQLAQEQVPQRTVHGFT